MPSASGVFAFEVGAEALLLRGALDRRSEMLARARELAFSRMAPSWDGEKDHSRYWEDCRYRASSVAMAGAAEGGGLAIREGERVCRVSLELNKEPAFRRRSWSGSARGRCRKRAEQVLGSIAGPGNDNSQAARWQSSWWCWGIKEGASNLGLEQKLRWGSR